MLEAKITLVELPATAGGLNGPLIYDVYSREKMPRGLPLLQAELKTAGYKDTTGLWGRKLTEDDWQRIVTSDILGISFITRTTRPSQELALEYKRRKPDGMVIAGGFHASALPEECLQWADYVVRGEGDEALPELVNALAADRSVKNIGGVSYLESGQYIENPDRDLLTEEQLSELPLPHYSLEDVQRRTIYPLNASRGCIYRCAFCSVAQMHRGCYRRRSSESVMDEISRNYLEKPNESIFITDDNTAPSNRRSEVEDLFEQMIRQGFDKKMLFAQFDANTACDREFIKLYRRAGGKVAFIGIESISSASLKAFKKGATAEQNIQAIATLREEGIWAHAMMIVGADGDTKESIDATLKWLKGPNGASSVQLFAATPLPGTPYTESMKKAGRLLSVSRNWDNYDVQHVLVAPKKPMTPYWLQQRILEGYKDFYSYKDIEHILGSLQPSHPFKLAIGRLLVDLSCRKFAHQILKEELANPYEQEFMASLKQLS